MDTLAFSWLSEQIIRENSDAIMFADLGHYGALAKGKALKERIKTLEEDRA